MEILEPKAELWDPRENPTAHVARCARVCYQSTPKDADSDKKLCNWLKKHGHNSMFRHASYYFLIPISDWEDGNVESWNKYDLQAFYDGSNPYVRIEFFNDYVCIATNGQVIMEYSTFNEDYNYNKLWRYAVTADRMKEVYPGMVRHTIWLQTQISTTRELNRVSPNNISEMSTRYVTQEGAIVRPHWMDPIRNSGIPTVHGWYVSACKDAFDNYKIAIDTWHLPKEDARGLLPLDTATQVVYTYSLTEWKAILDLRLYDKTGKAHPNCHVICQQIADLLNIKDEK